MSTRCYRDDVDFLSAFTEVLELSSETVARVAVTPAFQGRVMTSGLGGDAGASFGWINRAFIESRAEDPKFNNYGGEDRFWLGPEAGQFGLWFQPGESFTMDAFKTPDGLNSGPYLVRSASKGEVVMGRSFSLKNYSGTLFECEVERTIRLVPEETAAQALGAAISPGVSWVGFESKNVLTNAGREAWSRDSGLPSIWILGMFNPLARGKVLVPFVEGDEVGLGPKISDYFGAIPEERLVVGQDHANFACDGALRSKIGVSPRRAKDAIGSWDADAGVLTVVTFNLPPEASQLPYVNSQWEIQKEPYAGDVINSYNDGRDPATGTLLGPFYELETSSPGAELKPGESIVHVHRTMHLSGPLPELQAISKRVLNVESLS